MYVFSRSPLPDVWSLNLALSVKYTKTRKRPISILHLKHTQPYIAYNITKIVFSVHKYVCVVWLCVYTKNSP